MFHQVSGTVLFWRAHVSAFRRRHRWCCCFGSSWPPSFLALWWSSSGCPPDTSLGQTFQHTREYYRTTHELGFKYETLTECKRKNKCGTDSSLPGLILTWKTPMTGRWSDVLMLVQLVYLITFMSSAYLLLNTILSCERKYDVARDVQVKINFRSHAYETDLAGSFWRTVYEGVLCFEVLS